MKNKIVALFCVLIICACSVVFSQADNFDPEKLQNTMKGFSDSLAKSLPFNSTLGLN